METLSLKVRNNIVSVIRLQKPGFSKNSIRVRFSCGDFIGNLDLVDRQGLLPYK